MKNLLVAWFKSYAEALFFSNDILQNGSELLDCSIIGVWSQVIVLLKDKDMPIEILKKFHNDNENYRFAFFDSIPMEVIDSYLSLSSKSVKDFLCVVETDFIGSSFEIASKALESKVNVVDLRLLKFQAPKSILILTAAVEQKEKLLLVLENVKAQKKYQFDFRMISPVQKQIVDLFN